VELEKDILIYCYFKYRLITGINIASNDYEVGRKSWRKLDWHLKLLEI
jgi:hypothetical protein